MIGGSCGGGGGGLLTISLTMFSFTLEAGNRDEYNAEIYTWLLRLYTEMLKY